MKKMMICTAAFAFLFSLSMAGMSFAADNGPAEITLTTKDAKKPAVFPHHKHQSFLKCAQCHEAPNFPKGVAFDAWTMSMGHGFCKECHKKGVEGKKGPTTCTACHKK